MLSVERLAVAYGTTVAVSDLTLEVAPGEAVALLGPNGAGKSTTLRAISGLERHTGTVRFEGANLAQLSPHERAQLGLIHVPEGRRVFADLTVHENLQMGQAAASGRRAISVDEVYDLFPALRPLSRRLGFALSGGEQQMVALGRALLGAPRLLMLDEPSLGLAPQVTAQVASSLHALRSTLALLVVEQNVRLAMRLCDRLVVLRSGEAVLTAAVDEITDVNELMTSYLGQVAST